MGKQQLIIVSCITIILGVALMFVIPEGTKAIAREFMIKIREDALIFDHWTGYFMGNKYSVYLFNITNPIGILTRGEKPILQEVGPFVYTVYTPKDDILFHGENRVSYTKNKKFYFNSEESAFDPKNETNIITINAPLVIFMSMMPQIESQLEHMMSNNTITRQVYDLYKLKIREVLELSYMDLFVTRTADELLFGGKNDPLLTLASVIFPKNQKLKSFGGKFGWLRTSNTTQGPRITVMTGKHNFDKINEVERYEGKFLKDISWLQNKCQDNNPGSVFYHDDFDETIYKDVNMDLKIWGGIDYDDLEYSKYLPTHTCKIFKAKMIDDDYNCEMYDYKTKCKYFKSDNQYNYDNSPSNCYRNDNLGGKFPSGVIDTSVCRGEIPIYESNPHFLDADPSFQNMFHGLDPQEEYHQAYMQIEPTTGGVVEGRQLAQVNLYLDKDLYKHISIPDSLKLIPVFWWKTDGKPSFRQMKDMWIISKMTYIIGWTLGSVVTFCGLVMLIFVMIMF